MAGIGSAKVPRTAAAGSHDSSGWVPGTSRTRVYFLLRADSASVDVLADSDCCKRQDAWMMESKVVKEICIAGRQAT